MILGLVPARGGSKGIPRKNIRLLGGKPLIQWTIETARERSGYPLDRIVVSTEDAEIARRADSLGVDVLSRPWPLAADDTPMRDVVMHAIEAYPDYEHVMLLQPTSPFRTWGQIHHAAVLLQENNCDSVVSVRTIPPKYRPEWALRRNARDGNGEWFIPGHRPMRRQDLPESYYRDGEIYATRTDLFRQTGDFVSGRVVLQDIAAHHPCNLDDESDWREAERRL